MNKKILIFCEGVTDQVFIADCLEIFYSVKIKRDVKNGKIEMTFENGKIEDIEGCNNLKMQPYLERFIDNSAGGGINLVIFDADEEGKGNNSFTNAIKSLKDIKKNHQVDFDFYLWPNNKENGKVENLIRKLIEPGRECIMNCIENHQICLSTTGVMNLRKADEKDLIRYYLYSNNVEKTEGRHVDYKNNLLWNLNPSHIPDLQNFKLFLNNYFGNV